jgi:hypothetical protein
MECWNSGILGFENLKIGFIGKNPLQKNLKIGHLPLIPLFHHSNWGEAPKFNIRIFANIKMMGDL